MRDRGRGGGYGKGTHCRTLAFWFVAAGTTLLFVVGGHHNVARVLLCTGLLFAVLALAQDLPR
jgi:hypothetical protein